MQGSGAMRSAKPSDPAKLLPTCFHVSLLKNSSTISDFVDGRYGMIRFIRNLVVVVG
jgi:hypothetical protein